MTKYRNGLPQIGNELFLTDGGIETSLIFHEGLDLPDFAAFDLLKTEAGTAALRKYFGTYVALAQQVGAGIVLESATWRANADWGARLGYSTQALADANRQAVALLEEFRDGVEAGGKAAVISGCVGPRGDGYVVANAMTPPQAQAYHQEQIDAFAGTTADMVCAITMNYVDEGIGVTQAAKNAAMPVAISFTLETDGRLPTGQTLGSAIEQVDDATEGYASYFMINCAHPTHFDHVLGDGGAWVNRIGGLRANASRKSHAELDEAEELDMGDPGELAMQYAGLRKFLPHLTVMGGCCGTDQRHVEQIALACAPTFT